ncbi:MAG TPA: hypothetical protein DCZ92_01540 [Elusimicrobia bacterium]|nr:MAG: hypothetical protein A2016_12375 [Elusimicrobia bacterium GWF2_62_30]HBA59509.1 hypothetical protein [Elusimicrobiota bacterium]
MILLSICIPTYNRHEYLKRTLSAVTSQAAALPDPGQVEIVVSDNASVDATPEVVKSFAGPNFTASRNPANIGGSKNLNKVLELARGRHCWLMGDDDEIYPGAVKKVLEAVSSHPDAGLFFINYNRKADKGPIIRLPHDMYFKTAEEYVDYGLSHFDINEWDPAKFTFYTSLVIDREKWLAVPENTHPVINHAFKIHAFLPGLPVYLIAEPQLSLNDAPLKIEEGPKSLVGYWGEIYWYMGRRYGRRLGFLRVILRAYLANMKFKTLRRLRGLLGKK